MTTEMRGLIAVLRTLHDRLETFVRELDPEGLRRESYDTDWTVAHVLSHLGSGAELSLMRLEAGAGEGPGYEESAQVWAVWDAWTPEQQAVEAVAAEEKLVASLEGLDDPALAALHRDLAGLELDAAQVLGLRVSEQAMHGWDVMVSFDETTTLAPEAVVPLLDLLPVTLRWAAQPHDDVLRVRIRTSEPDGDHVLELSQGETRLRPGGDGEVAGELRLPAEALLRLVYGRLDPAHTPPVEASDDALLGRLRSLFQGF